MRGTLTDPTASHRLTTEWRRLDQDRAALRAGTGAWADTPAGNAARRVNASHHAHQAALRRVEQPGLSRRDRRAVRHEVDQLDDAVTRARAAWERHGRPADDQLTHQINAVKDQCGAYPGDLDRYEIDELVDRRLHHFEAELGIAPEPPPPRHLGARDLDHGIGLGF